MAEATASSSQCHIEIFHQYKDPEDCLKRFQELSEKLTTDDREGLLQLATKMYLLGIEDARNQWGNHIGSVGMWGLKHLYDKIEPNHNLVFY